MNNVNINYKFKNIIYNYYKIIQKDMDRVMNRMNKMKIYKMLKDNYVNIYKRLCKFKKVLQKYLKKLKQSRRIIISQKTIINIVN